jgi:uncharacterized protein (DUF2132 family)
MDPLHGITLERMLIELHEELGWEHMAYLVPINCLKNDPSVKSSLVFIRRTPWARKKVEQMYLERIVEFRKKDSH